MVAPIILVGAGIGGVVLVAGQEAPAPKPTMKAPSGGTVLPGQTNAAGGSVKLSVRLPAIIGRSRSYAPRPTTEEPTIHTTQIATNTGTSSANSNDPLLQGKLNEIEAKAKDAYGKLSSEAKAAGAKALNDSLDISPPLTGNEDYETMASIAGGAAGAAAGAAIGGPIGAKVGAIVGAYLGVKLEDLLAKNWDELEAWMDAQWSDLESYASDAADAVGGAAEDAYNYVGDLL